MAENQRDADLINEDRCKMAEMWKEQLEKMGVSVRIAHYTGDSSYPTEYTLAHGGVVAYGPTLDLAILDFVERLLKADAHQLVMSIGALRETTDTAIKHLAGHVSHLAQQFQIDHQGQQEEEF